jgi:hypothetical protein
MSEELESLRNKNRELLDELKKAKAKNTTLEKLEEQLTAAKTEVLELKLHQPVRTLLDQVLIPPNKYAILDVMDDFKFQLDDDGKIQMLGSDEKAVEFTVESVTDFLGGVDKYAGFVRAMAHNKTVDTPNKGDPPKTHFGIR